MAWLERVPKAALWLEEDMRGVVWDRRCPQRRLPKLLVEAVHGTIAGPVRIPLRDADRLELALWRSVACVAFGLRFPVSTVPALNWESYGNQTNSTARVLKTARGLIGV